MSASTFSRLWEESKAQHHADTEARASEFRKDFEKTWSLFRRPLFYVMLISFVIPSLRHRFAVERNAVRGELKKIVAEYVPQIRTELTRWEDGFNQWETENSETSLCGSVSARRKESEGRENAKRLSIEMIVRIGAIPQYDWHFHPIENPAKMVANPYPGYLTSERARNYVTTLFQVFG